MQDSIPAILDTCENMVSYNLFVKEQGTPPVEGVGVVSPKRGVNKSHVVENISRIRELVLFPYNKTYLISLVLIDKKFVLIVLISVCIHFELSGLLMSLTIELLDSLA